MSMRRIINLVEARTKAYELPAKWENTSRSFVRVIDAFNRAEKKAEGTGPKAAFDSIVRRIDKLGGGSEGKRIGIIYMLKLMYSAKEFAYAAEHKNLVAHQFVNEIPDWKFTSQDKEEIKRILRTLGEGTYLDRYDDHIIS